LEVLTTILVAQQADHSKWGKAGKYRFPWPFLGRRKMMFFLLQIHPGEDDLREDTYIQSKKGMQHNAINAH